MGTIGAVSTCRLDDADQKHPLVSAESAAIKSATRAAKEVSAMSATCFWSAQSRPFLLPRLPHSMMARCPR